MAGADRATGKDRRPRRRGVGRRLAVWSARILGLLVLLPLVAVTVLIARVWLGQPELDGERRVRGLAEAATIQRDGKGVVHIDAANEQDAYFALGFAHAQDRFFQMELMRRLAAGRLAEIAGPPVVDLDMRMRRLGLSRLAHGDVAALSPEALATFEAYADGVNAWLATRRGVAADELALLLAPAPAPWLPEHSLAWNRLMSLRLVSNWASELMRLRLSQVLSPDQIADLWPDYPADGPVSVPELPPAALAAAAGFAALANPDDGSNAWAVTAAAAASGAGLLANDPHLGLSNPGTWHLVSLRAPGLRLAGATAPGVPTFVLGHNGHVAWGLTNAATDTSDLYVERIDPKDPGRYLTPDGSLPFVTRTETIQVRFGAPREMTVRSTRHGPVISDGDRFDLPADLALALAHTGLLDQEGSAETLFRINRARSWADALAAMALTKGPQQNAFYAGPDGAGMATAGQLPVRRAADGYMPADGATDAGDWVAFADVAAMPQTFEPARGWVANANNKLVQEADYPLWLGGEWGYAGRIARLERLLDAAAPLDADRMAAIQYDNVSPIAQALLPRMLQAIADAPLSPRQRDLRARLRGWDHDTGMDRPEPLVFFAWMRAAMGRVFADELGAHFGDWFSLRVEPLAHVLAGRHVWCEDVNTAETETCEDILTAALADAEAWIAARHGDDPADWRWGDAHQAEFRHMPFGLVPGLNRLFNIRLPTPGGQETINRAAFRISNEDGPFVQAHGPTLRAVYDLADLEKSRFVAAPGQSGRLFSPHRADMAEDWRDGRYASLAPLGAAAHTLTLLPEGQE